MQQQRGSQYKKPKLDIQKIGIRTQSVVTACTSLAGRSGSLRRANSLPADNVKRPSNEPDLMFCDDLDDFEVAALAEAADVAENEALNTVKAKPNIILDTKPSTSGLPREFRNNGSSGFEDALFAEDIDEDVVEECMQLATAYSQDIQRKNEVPCNSSITSQAYEAFSKGIGAHSSILESQKTFKKPLPILPASSTNLNHLTGNQNNIRQHPQTTRAPPVKPPLIQFSRSSSNTSSASALTSQAETEIRRLGLEQEKILAENKKLKSDLRTKDGETKNLRLHIKTLEEKCVRQKIANSQAAVVSQQHYKERVDALQKQVESLETKLRLQELETRTERQRSKLLSFSQRCKLIEPQSPSSARHNSSFLNKSAFEVDNISPPRPPAKRPRLDDVNTTVVKEEIPRLSPPEEKKEIGVSCEFEARWNLDPVIYSVGNSFLERLAGRPLVDLNSFEELFNTVKSEENNLDSIPTASLLSLKLVQATRKRWTNIPKEMRPGLTHCSDSLRLLMCWKGPSLDVTGAESLITKVAEECCGIVHFYLLLLKDSGNNMTERQLNYQDKIVDCGIKCPLLNQDFDLLDDKKWYAEERWVDVRRSLGVLSELASVSQFAASLLSDDLPSSQQSLTPHKFTKLPGFEAENKSVNQREHLEGNNEKDVIFILDDNDEQSSSVAPAKQIADDGLKFWFLQILLDFCKEIVRQKQTVPLNGVLAGVIVLLKNCAKRGTLTQESRNIVLTVIREILLARPASVVLLYLLDLLKYVSNCEEIMAGMCCNCDGEDCYNDASDGVYYFKRNACLLQMLCVQLRAVPQSSRWWLTEAVVRWLSAVLALGNNAPSWMLPVPSDPGTQETTPVHEMCCLCLTSTLVSLLYDHFHLPHTSEIRGSVESSAFSAGELKSQSTDSIPSNTLIRMMQRAITLLHGLIVNGMANYMGQVEGLYELLIKGIFQMQDQLNLSPVLKLQLEDLVQLEQQDMETNGNAENESEYWKHALTIIGLDLLPDR